MAEQSKEPRLDAWADGESYDQYMGRWSRKVAREFLAWLARPHGLTWVDVGCGTGALTGAILETSAPKAVVAIDPSAAFVSYARSVLAGRRARFEIGDAGALPIPDGCADVAVSALAYNFFPDRPVALGEMRRVSRRGATIAFYVWDYPGGGMGFMDAFWEAAIAVEPSAASAGERSRFPFCAPETLLEEARAAGLAEPEVRPIEVVAEFADFDDLWLPFTRGTGPAPAYFKRLEPGAQSRLRQHLETSTGGRAPIHYPARAWAVRGRAE